MPSSSSFLTSPCKIQIDVNSHFDAGDEQGGPGLVHAHTHPVVWHLLQLPVLYPGHRPPRPARTVGRRGGDGWWLVLGNKLQNNVTLSSRSPVMAYWNIIIICY